MEILDVGQAMKALLSTGFNNGEEIRVAAEGATGGRLVNIDCALRECLVWTKISSANISLRLKKQGIFFSDAAPGVFTNRMKHFIIYWHC